MTAAAPPSASDRPPAHPQHLGRNIGIAICTGILLAFALGLQPVWWLAWLAPVPLLALAFDAPLKTACPMVALAALIGASANARYYALLMPLPAVSAVVAANTLLWTFVVLGARRIVVRYRRWWCALAYPVLWVACDTVMAAFLPDGNWGSYAYSQADFLPMAQLAALFGVSGILFLLALFASTLAMALVYGRTIAHGRWLYGGTALLLLLAYGYGSLRLQLADGGQQTVFGLAAIDDVVDSRSPAPQVAELWRQYDRHVATLAAQGAQIIVLPEKIAVLKPSQALQWQQHLAALATQQQVWLEAGIGLDEGGSRSNLAWLFAPDGTRAASYQKHFMAPPERDFIAGHAYELHAIKGLSYGLAICKDMHFAALGRQYGMRHADVMLVPAWDFGLDSWLAARMTALRGIENGYVVVRSARNGWLTVSDAYGRVLAQAGSRGLPGSALLARVPVRPQIATLYTLTGNLLGWICVGAAALVLLTGRRWHRRAARAEQAI